MSEPAREVLAVARERVHQFEPSLAGVSIPQLRNHFGDRFTYEQLIFALADLLDAGLLIWSGPGKYRTTQRAARAGGAG